MGIQGLLPMLKSIMVPMHVKDLAGQSVAVDTYSWLHKGAFSCSREICKGLPTSRYVDYCMYRVNLLRHFGIKPILVFDGGLLPMKVDQEIKRSRMRKENLERALEHESAGNTAAAYEYYQKAVDISPSVAYHLIQVLKEENVDYIVAPYEADAQMAFLVMQKYVDAVITEDSDLIPFGCSRIIYKMDKFGQGVEFRCSLLGQNKELNFADFTQQMFLEMCILSGCDYLQSLPGMGLRRAHALIQKFKSYEKVIKHLKYSAVSVPPLYEENFKKAIWTFRHQRVYNPKLEDIVHLSEIPHDLMDDMDYLGPPLPQTVVKGIAKGYIDPFTQLPFEAEIIHVASAPNEAYSLKEFKPRNERKWLDLPVKKNVLTNYFCLASVEAKRKYKAPQVNCKQLLTMEGSLPGNEKFVHSDNAAGSLLKSSEDLISDTDDCDVIAKFQDKRDAIVNLSDKGHMRRSQHSQLLQLKNGSSLPSLMSHNFLEGEAKCITKVDSSKRCYFPLASNGVKDGDDEASLQHEDTDKISHDDTMPRCAAIAAVPLKKAKRVHAQDDHGKKPSVQTEKKKPLDCVTSSAASRNDLAGNETSTSIQKFVDKNGGQKLQCDISHLDRYSDIAEKSMKNFVSVMSSFRYVPSGSRASGLRAPLKDVKNINAARPSIAPAEL